MDNQSLQNQITELRARLDALSNYVTIPLEVGGAMKARIFGTNLTVTGAATSGAPGSINAVTAVNFGGGTTSSTPVSAPFTKQVVLTLDDGSVYTVPAN